MINKRKQFKKHLSYTIYTGFSDFCKDMEPSLYKELWVALYSGTEYSELFYMMGHCSREI